MKRQLDDSVTVARGGTTYAAEGPVSEIRARLEGPDQWDVRQLQQDIRTLLRILDAK